MRKRKYKSKTRRRVRFNKRAGGEHRGSSYDRRKRKEWLLKTFGDGETAPCAHCGKDLDSLALTVDRIVPGFQGGSYRRGNIFPSCYKCNAERYHKDPKGYHSIGLKTKTNPYWRRRKNRRVR